MKYEVKLEFKPGGFEGDEFFGPYCEARVRGKKGRFSATYLKHCYKPGAFKRFLGQSWERNIRNSLEKGKKNIHSEYEAWLERIRTEVNINPVGLQNLWNGGSDGN